MKQSAAELCDQAGHQEKIEAKSTKDVVMMSEDYKQKAYNYTRNKKNSVQEPIDNVPRERRADLIR